MAYIGRSPQAGNYSKLDNIAASFNDSLTTFNLTVAGAAFTASQSTQLLISVDGVLQEPETAYTVSGSNITFTSAPASGASFFGVALGDTLDIGVPSNGTVTAAKIAAGAVSNTALAAGAVSNTALAAGAVTAHAVAAGAISSNTQLATGVVTRHAIAPSANVAYANISQKFTKSQYGNTYAYGTLIANTAWRPDLTQGNFVSLTLGGNITINNPSTQNAGQTGAFLITNGGSHTVSWGSDFKFASGTAPTITASGTDVVSYYIGSANNIYVDALQALS